MVKAKNVNVGKGESFEEGESSRGRTGKGKRVVTGVRALERFISIKEAANFEEWKRKRRKIAAGHGIDLSDMEGMEIIPNLFEDTGWGPLLTVNELFYPEMIYEFYANLHKDRVQKQGNITYQCIIIPNVGHKSFITNMHSFVMLALHEHRRMNFGYMPTEHMLATHTSSIKCLPYVCFLTRVFQYFVLSLIGVGDPIGPGKIYNKHTFKRMSFSKNEEGMLVRGGKDDNESDEDDEGNEGQEAMNVDEEDSEKESEEEIHRREMRQKKLQERFEEGLKPVIPFSAAKKINVRFLSFQNENQSSDFFKPNKNQSSYFEKWSSDFLFIKKIRRPILKIGHPVFTFTVKKMTVG
ncbi:hypothetical protein M9H77_17078 [Catharanthus roseus]|uniref:Uncharacterized protein n=1 Tax=Catharanthus roseus TaxID=4058 RepID=A0ACC0B3J6_CATRO|nr:hypothetical protein M9H77_17078 [Catharanthus roseus]